MGEGNQNEKKKETEKLQCEETNQLSEPDSDMTWILKLSDVELKLSMMTMLKTLTEKVDQMQEQIGDFRRDMETIGTQRRWWK